MHYAPLRQRNFALLWWAGLISIGGDWMLKIALPIYVLQLTGSALATSGVVMAGLLPVLLVGLVAGVYVDRWDRRRILAVVSVLQGLFLLPLLAADAPDRLWIVYGVTFAESTLAQFFLPAENALLPRLVAVEQLPAANSLNTLNNNIARLLGPAVGGVVAAALGLHGVAVLDAVTFLVAAGLIAGIRGDFRAAAGEPAADEVPSPRVRRDLAEGLRVIGRPPMTKALLLIITVTSIGEGVMGSLFVIFVTRPLHGGPAQVGWLMSAQAVGGVLGGLAGAPIAARFAPTRLAAISLMLFGLIDIAIFNYPRWAAKLWPELLMMGLVGIPAVLMSAAMMTLLQREIADAFLGRVFAVTLVAESLAGLLGTGLAGSLNDRVGVLNLLTIQGTCPLLCGIAFAVFARRRMAEAGEAAVVSPALANAGDPS